VHGIANDPAAALGQDHGAPIDMFHHVAVNGESLCPGDEHSIVRIERIVDLQTFDDRTVGPAAIRGWPDVDHRVAEGTQTRSVHGHRRCGAGAQRNG